MYTRLLRLGCFEFFCLPGGLREHPGAYEDNGSSQGGCEVTGYPASARTWSHPELICCLFEVEVGWERSGRSQTCTKADMSWLALSERQDFFFSSLRSELDFIPWELGCCVSY